MADMDPVASTETRSLTWKPRPSSGSNRIREPRSPRRFAVDDVARTVVDGEADARAQKELVADLPAQAGRGEVGTAFGADRDEGRKATAPPTAFSALIRPPRQPA